MTVTYERVFAVVASDTAACTGSFFFNLIQDKLSCSATGVK
jgi:hypothetical protein